MGKIIDPKLLKDMLSLNLDEVLIPLRMKKENVRIIKAVDFSEQEALSVQAFQDFLVTWGYLPENSFESLFIYLFNLACALHKPVVEYEAQMGKAFDPDNLAPKSQV